MKKKTDNKKLDIILKKVSGLEKTTNKRFSGVETRLSGMETGLFTLEKHLTSHERKTEQGFNELRDDFHQLQNAVGAYAKKS